MIALLLACTPTLVVTDDTADTQDTQEEVADPVPDYRSYTADLTWTWETWGDGCEDTTFETAGPVEDEEILAALAEGCGLCDAFYLAIQDKDKLCDSDWYQVPVEDYRGLVLDEDKGIAQLYRFDEDRNGNWDEVQLDGSATFDGWTVTFESVPVSTWGAELTVAGTITFPELETE